jgi:hypothetical protein
MPADRPPGRPGPGERLVHKLLRHILVTDADQDAAKALICGYAIELREVQPLGSHTYPTPSRPFFITLNPAASPDQADLALTTFLLKILTPGFFVRDRPDRASPRKTKKAGDFPARKPGLTSVTSRSSSTRSTPWQVT